MTNKFTVSTTNNLNKKASQKIDVAYLEMSKSLGSGHRLSGKVAIVTGAGRGMGRAMALALAREGADVVVAARTESEIRAAAEEIGKLGRKTLAMKTDVSKRKDVENLVQATIGKFEKIDILVNNAGRTSLDIDFIEMSDGDWDSTIDIDLKSVFLCSQCVIREMLKTGGGSIINVASGLGERALSKKSAYSAAKGGVIALTKALACEFGPFNINVNSISPGLVRSTMTKKKLENDEFRNIYIRQTPLRRVGEPEDITGAVVFLASEEARFITGVHLPVDGGQLASLRWAPHLDPKIS